MSLYYHYYYENVYKILNFKFIPEYTTKQIDKEKNYLFNYIINN